MEAIETSLFNPTEAVRERRAAVCAYTSQSFKSHTDNAGSTGLSLIEMPLVVQLLDYADLGSQWLMQNRCYPPLFVHMLILKCSTQVGQNLHSIYFSGTFPQQKTGPIAGHQHLGTESIL
jgi:hypothetical protein